MVRFIKQEAEEKANEIRVSAEEVGAECCYVRHHA
jgi:vacuolar-type H+-ATPase subunit E/Vma4